MVLLLHDSVSMKTGNYNVRNLYDITIPRWSIGFWDADKNQWFQDYDHTVPLTVAEVGEPATFYKFLLSCIDGGHGWGKVGQKSLMCCQGKTKKEAETKLLNNIPGGWTYRCLGQTEETFYLCHL